MGGQWIFFFVGLRTEEKMGVMTVVLGDQLMLYGRFGRGILTVKRERE